MPQVNKSRLIERIAQLVNDKIIDDVSDIRDESDRDGMRIVVELKRGGEPQLVLNQLFKHTSMQESFSMILLAVVNQQPKEMGLVQAIHHFIDHRVDVVRRRTAFLLLKAKEREHILEGYQTALDHLDNVIAIIRGSANRAAARNNWSPTFAREKDRHQHHGPGAEDGSGKAFFRDPSRRDPRIAIAPPHQAFRSMKSWKKLGLVRDVAEYESILASEKKLRGIIVKELEEVKKQYGDERRTVIEDEAAEMMLEDLIADQQVAVTSAPLPGYIKRTPISTYRMQRRGARAVPA